jgi:proline iminopeptidase
MLDVGEGNLVYWEVCGNPEGKPALVVHGGPGSGCWTGWRRYFDPDRYRIVLFDQRGCGRSTPHASDPAVDMRHNTTWHLIADMEQLREHLGIDRWLLYGGSWGSTLILAYAQQHPQRVSEIVIAAVTMTRRSEIDWLHRGVGRFFPEQWERFLEGAPGTPSDGDVVAAYARLMEHPDAAVRERPRPTGAPGRTRSCPERPVAPPTRTAIVLRPPDWLSCGSVPTTFLTARGSRKAYFCVRPVGCPASPVF